jgi:hypothetical protein
LHNPIINICMEASRSDATSGSTPEARSYQLQYEPAQESYCPLPSLLRANVTACTQLLRLQPLTYLCSASPTLGATPRLSYETAPTTPHLPPQWKPHRYRQTQVLSVHTCFELPQSFVTAFTTNACLRRRSSLLMGTVSKSLLCYAPAVRFGGKHRRFSSPTHSVFRRSR